ncbi:hypothetical protein VE01_04340 [Pseudogymnoascus verrucosus]|uniref:ABM domain-containing protein n=1 Tax=Pseudogymnoascus verrucosus TaxID=342668 RepID=A0A1B8GNM8_9PEZI|nr:uncharacterized protein VE01_04340 [Pseudogymnoascus verrucosus]OBT97427.1 hypothetical protein VE01_04340 [Pseudogymnoascus verrucosus]
MFNIYGNVQFVPGKYDAWQNAYDKLATYVADAERNSTLTYYFGVPVEFEGNHSATPHMLAFEVYNTREDLYDTHLKSPAMGEFLVTVPDSMSTGLDLTHYTETSGFLDKSTNCRECKIIYDTQIVCNSAQDRDTILAKLAAVAKHAEEKEEDTYTFLVQKSLDNETHVRIFERYASWAAMESHQKSSVLVNFWLGSKGEIKSMEGRPYVPNNKGWLHHRV